MWVTLLSAPLIPDKAISKLEQRCMRLEPPMNFHALAVVYACFFLGMLWVLTVDTSGRA